MKKIIILAFCMLLFNYVFAADPDIEQTGMSGSSSSLLDSVTTSDVVYVKGKAIKGTATAVTGTWRSTGNNDQVRILYYTASTPTSGTFLSGANVSISNWSYNPTDSIYTFRITMPSSIPSSANSFQIFFGLRGEDNIGDPIYGTRHTTYIDYSSYTASGSYTLDSNHQRYLEIYQDTITETPTLTYPSTNEHDNNPTDVEFNLPEAGADGTVELIFKRTGQRHVCTVVSEAQGIHSFDINPTSLAAGAEISDVTGGASLTANVAYTVVIKYQDYLSNPADSASITGYVYDTVTETPSLDLPAEGATVGANFTVQYDQPENAYSGTVKITITRTGGTADPESPHIGVITSTTAGTDKTLTLDTSNLGNTSGTTSETNWASSDLENGAIYTIKIEYKDFLNNSATSDENYNIEYRDEGIIYVSGGDYGPGTNFGPGTQNNAFYWSKLEWDGNGSTPTATSMKFDIFGTLVASDIDSLKLWRSNDNTYDPPGSKADTKIGSTTFSDPVTFSGLNEAITQTGYYYFLTVDVSSSANPENEIGAKIDDKTCITSSAGVSEASGYSFPIIGGTHTLPVELSAFIVQLLNNTPTLYWITQTETNNLGFNVYRGEYEDAYKDDKVIKVNGSIIAGQGTTSQAHDYLYKDYNEIENGKQYWYWLESVNYDGTTDLYDPIIFVMQEKKTSNRGPKIPQKYGLYQNAPNPFSCKGGSVYSGNTKTMIKFKLRNEGQSVVPVTLDIYNIKGQLIKTLIDNEYKEVNKIYSVFWEPESINSGIYFYRLKTPYSVEVKKMIVLK